jgi:23S rRNA (uridine2552-2'-O)-methyltransferase
MAYNRKDYYFQKAKKENYAARSAFKLEEIDHRLKFFRPGMKVLDLGAAPGSWSQYASKKIGAKGRILGIDLQPVRVTLPNAKFILADLKDIDLGEMMNKEGISPPFDCVISDMAPRTIGIRETDQVRSTELCHLALDTAARFIKEGGNFICKLFHSNDFEEIRKRMRNEYQKVDVIRPDSTRKESKEIFLIGLHYKGTKDT